MCAMASITISPLEMGSRFTELKVGQACLQTSNPDCISAAHTSSCSFVTWVTQIVCLEAGCHVQPVHPKTIAKHKQFAVQVVVVILSSHVKGIAESPLQPAQ